MSRMSVPIFLCVTPEVQVKLRGLLGKRWKPPGVVRADIEGIEEIDRLMRQKPKPYKKKVVVE